jgi:hypothetical protein
VLGLLFEQSLERLAGAIEHGSDEQKTSAINSAALAAPPRSPGNRDR